ncbi:MAG: KilA-N domain-containing protein, partial [Tolypothrix sp. Co-bin9]|nr:KilA-N domain-containing protein [Tolypothrix sp. Co-bin9]
MAKIQKVCRSVNGIAVEQRVADGFINGTAMCVAHNKEIKFWLRNKETFSLFAELAQVEGIKTNVIIIPDSDIVKLSVKKYGEIFPQLICGKPGSPENGGGTWLHPDLAIQLAQWCSPAFAIQVSRWVREWMTTGQNPIWVQADLDRVVYRDTLKDESRRRMTNQVKIYLQQIKKYDDQKYRGIFFAKVHDSINIAVTSETAKQMRVRLSEILGREVKESELIRDYFPALHLTRYISVCEAGANFMIRDDLHPISAIERAIE